MSLKVTSLTCRRGDVAIQTDLSFNSVTGTALFLRGPNGVGKTTLLRTLAGFLPVPSGDAVLFGESLREKRDFYLEQVALAGHLDAVKPQLSVLETLRFWAVLHASDGVEQALEDFDLGDLRAHAAGRLSAGQRRRLGLARLSLTGAKLWLMDEPANSLDSKSTAKLAARIDQHLDQGGLAIIATHTDIPVKNADTLVLEKSRIAATKDPFLESFA